MNHRLLIVAGVALAWSASSALAQSKAETARRADQYYVAAGQTYNMHAHDHVRLLGKYAAAAAHPVPSDVVKEHTAAIRGNVERAGQSFARLDESAGKSPGMAAQLAEIKKRLAAVTTQLTRLNASSANERVDSRLVLSQTAAIAQDLKAAHLASKKIDSALAQSLEADEQFDNPQSNSYYFTGEGHFLD
jgi:hypothetical protein